MSFAAGAFSSGVGGRGGGDGGRRLFTKAKEKDTKESKEGQDGSGGRDGNGHASSSITASLMFHAMATMGSGGNKVTQCEASANKENAKDHVLHPDHVDHHHHDKNFEG